MSPGQPPNRTRRPAIFLARNVFAPIAIRRGTNGCAPIEIRTNRNEDPGKVLSIDKKEADNFPGGIHLT